MAEAHFITRRNFFTTAIAASGVAASGGVSLASLTHSLTKTPFSTVKETRIKSALEELERALCADGWQEFEWEVSIRNQTASFMMLDHKGWKFV